MRYVPNGPTVGPPDKRPEGPRPKYEPSMAVARKILRDSQIKMENIHLISPELAPPHNSDTLETSEHVSNPHKQNVAQERVDSEQDGFAAADES